MKEEIALRILDMVMQWDIDRAREEFRWLRLMSRLKYDGYQDFVAGARFIECLLYWLQQFDQADRKIAYEFVRKHMVYVSEAEIQHLVEQFYAETVCWHILSEISSQFNIPKWQIYANPTARQEFENLRRRTLFLGLSDGARMDVFRRANVGRISNEQVVATYRFDDEKWDELLDDLRKDIGDVSAKFALVYLIDDFVGSGLTLLRKDTRDNKWKGRLVRTWESIKDHVTRHFEQNWTLCIHHYVGTYQGLSNVESRQQEAKREKGDEWFDRVKFSFGMLADFSMDEQYSNQLSELIDKYYDPGIESKHSEVGGKDLRNGFGGCKFPVVLEHNTPNNSFALLWAESEGSNQHHAMRPLFRRRQRHL